MEPLIDYIKEDYIVYIRCSTYNHSNYIKAALDGFAMQNTNFPYVCVIVDDCSSDGEQDVIKSWMKDECNPNSVEYYDLELSHLYCVTHKKNTNCKFAFYLLKQNLYGDERKQKLIEPWRGHTKYEACCEGDDYWNYPNKLQEQIVFLESHDDYSATSSNALVLRSESIPMKPFGTNTNKDFYKIQEVIRQRQFHTGTVVFRTSSMLDCPHYRKGGWDTFMWCCLLSQGPIHYDGKVTCVYRKQNQGVTESTPTLNWLTIISGWADIITDCFVPKFVQRKYVVRSVTNYIILAAFQGSKQYYKDYKKKLWSLYCHNFDIRNVLYDLRTVFRQCVKKVIRRNKTLNVFFSNL